MPAEDLSDDYVAQLIAKDARSSAIEYSSYGLQAFLPRRATHNAPKPNTRFLKNIIRDTDNHNAALKAKEEQEARARLRELHRSSGENSRPIFREARLENEDGHRFKRRKLDEINGILGGRVKASVKSQSESFVDRERDEDINSISRRLRHQRRQHSDDESREDDKSTHQSRKHRHSHHHRHKRHHDGDPEKDSRRDSRDRDHMSSRRSRSRSPRSDRKDRHHRRNSHRERTRSISPSRPLQSKNGNEHAKPPNRCISPVAVKDEDSDPLESLGLIGPKPATPPPKLKSRGRGAFAPHQSSIIDQHFKSNYDPAIDVVPDVAEDDDWDLALEAMKDRQKWQQNQVERMRQAGFTEEELVKWKEAKTPALGGEGREEDVKWKGRGEGREWDRGKVVGIDGEGATDIKIEWGRLKGT